jgi:hypothetical protein
MNMKSQFVTGGTAEEGKTSPPTGHLDFLKASLGVMTASALDAQAKRDLATMTTYVDANPNTTNRERFNGYVEKITRAYETTAPKSAPRAKPMGGGMI